MERKRNKHTFIKGIELIEDFMKWIAVSAIMFMLAAISYGIFAREVLSAPVLWTNDFASYLMVYAAFMGAPWVLKEKGHVTVDIMATKLKGTAKKINTIFISGVSIFALSMYVYYSFEIVWDYFVTNSVMLQNFPYPKFLLYLPISVGSLFLIIRFCIMSYDAFREEDQIEFDQEGRV